METEEVRGEVGNAEEDDDDDADNDTGACDTDVVPKSLRCLPRAVARSDISYSPLLATLSVSAVEFPSVFCSADDDEEAEKG